jgi:hypothetical protein
MTVVDTIRNKMTRLPEPRQREVLDFVDYLLHKSREEDVVWSELSLASALRGLEDEEWPDYDEADFTERWS